MTLTMKNPKDADRIWHMERPGELKVSVTDSDKMVRTVLFESASSVTDETCVWFAGARSTRFIGRMKWVAIDDESVRIETTGGQVVLRMK